MKRVSELLVGRLVKGRWLAHLLLTVCLLTIAGPVIALADARMEADAEQVLNSENHKPSSLSIGSLS